MLVISTKLFVGVFIALYASVTSAIPFDAVTSNTTALEPRQPGEGNECGAMVFIRHACAPNFGPRAWSHVCRNDHFEVRVPGVPSCPVNTYCEDILTRAKGYVEDTIRCVAGSAPGVAQTRKRKSDPQIGSSPNKQAARGIGTSTMYHQLGISDDMLASVSAFFLSEFLTL
jgi:hypothetical protein